jgi:hypothetical protein
MEELRTRTKSPPTLLQISEKGELRLSGNYSPESLQPVLDASLLQSREYLRHQEKLSREANLMSIYLGVIFASIFGLTVFCLFNLKPQSNNHAKSTIPQLIWFV